jgi:hypothetical protein
MIRTSVATESAPLCSMMSYYGSGLRDCVYTAYGPRYELFTSSALSRDIQSDIDRARSRIRMQLTYRHGYVPKCFEIAGLWGRTKPALSRYSWWDWTPREYYPYYRTTPYGSYSAHRPHSYLRRTPIYLQSMPYRYRYYGV